MKKDIFEHNWIFRANNGWLYGFQCKPSLENSIGFLNNYVIATPIPGEKAKLIKETGKDYNFIPKNVLLHISDLAKYEFKFNSEEKETAVY